MHAIYNEKTLLCTHSTMGNTIMDRFYRGGGGGDYYAHILQGETLLCTHSTRGDIINKSILSDVDVQLHKEKITFKSMLD